MDVGWGGIFIVLVMLASAAAVYGIAIYLLVRLGRHGWRRFANRNAKPS